MSGYYDRYLNDVEGTDDAVEDTKERYRMVMSYRNVYEGEKRKVLKDTLWGLGFLRALDLDNLAAVVRYNEAIMLLIKLGILTDRGSFDRIIDAIMNLPVIEKSP